MRQPSPALVLLATLATLAATARGSPAPPYEIDVHLDPEAVPPGGAFRVAVVLHLRSDFHLNANPPSEPWQVPTTLTPEPHAAVTWGRVHYPEGTPLEAEWADGKAASVYSGETGLLAGGRLAEDAAGTVEAELALRFQGCTDQACHQPETRTVRVAVPVAEPGAPPAPSAWDGFAGAPSAEALLASAGHDGDGDKGATAAPREVRFEGETDIAARLDQGWLVFLVVLYLGGLALNLTPCVFPLIPVTMNVFAQQGEHRPLKVLPLAVLYALGIAATFTVVGLVAALGGQSVGFALQSPWGVLVVVAVLAVMMASSFGAFDLQLPSGLMGKVSGARRGALGAAGAGMVMGLVAAPCVGPFMIALIALVAAEGSLVLGAVAFFAVGLGLGTPFIILGTFTGLLNRFPRSGGWLVWTKRVLGMALAGLILYFVRPYLDGAFFWPLVVGVLAFAAVYLALVEGLSRRPFSAAFKAARAVVGVACLAGAAYVLAVYAMPATRAAPAVGGHVAGAAGPHVQWTAWHPGALEAAREARRPVLLYFTADWCAECRVWQAKVFADEAVLPASEALARIKVDVTQSPEGEKLALAQAYRGVNPPAVIVLGRDGAVEAAWRDPPTAEAFAAALRQAAGG